MTAHTPERSYVGPRFEDASVRDAMQVGVITCRPETSLGDVARMMVGYDVHAVVVWDVPGEPEAVWGIVTSLDLARAPNRLETTSAGEIASTDVVTIGAEEPLRRAAEVMAEHRFSHLIAVQPETGQPVGMISARAIAAALAHGMGY